MSQNQLTQGLLEVLKQQQALSQNKPTLNTGLLAPGQQGIGDVLTNPDQAQVNALIGGLAGALNPQSGAPILEGIAGAARGFSGTRQAEFEQRLAERKQQQDELSAKLDSIVKVGQLGVSMGRFDKIDLPRFQAEGKKASKTGHIIINGKRVTAAKNQEGRLIAQMQGGPKDVSGQGFEFIPDTTQSQTNQFDFGDKKEVAVFNAELELIKGEREKFEAAIGSTLPLLSQARTLNNALQKSGGTGKLVAEVTTFKEIANMVGPAIGFDPDFDVSRISDVRQFQSLQSRFKSGLIAQTKGSISDKENAEFLNASPGPDKPGLANRYNINFLESSILSQSEKQDAKMQWLISKGNTVGFNRSWDRYTSAFPRTSGIDGEFSVIRSNLGNFDLYLTGKPPKVVSPDGAEEFSIQDLKKQYGSRIGEGIELLRAQGWEFK